MSKHYYQGKFRPRNPHKYKGDLDNIIFRSAWELKMFKYCDLNDGVVEWSSEVPVPYRNPISLRKARYFIDIYMKFKKKDGTVEKKLIEIKPLAQTKPPKKQQRKTKQYIRQVETWAINNAKWDAAKKHAEQNHMKFHIMTEKELGIN